MISKVLHSTLFALALIALTACSVQPTLAPTTAPTLAGPSTGTKAIVLGAIQSDPAATIKAFQPLADYLAAHLGQVGVTVGDVKVAPDQATMIKWLKDGTVDLYFDSPYSAMIMNDQAGAQIILRQWKSGVAEYKGLILVRKDSGLKSLADLKGHLVAMDGPSSTTGYMIELAYMLQGGLKVNQKSGISSAVAADEVGYTFVGQENVTALLANGKVSAGVFSDQDIKDLPADVMDKLSVLIETETLPRYLALARAGLDSGELQAVKTLLIGLDQTAEGPAILKTFSKTKKFDELPNTDAMLGRLRELYQLVSSQ